MTQQAVAHHPSVSLQATAAAAQAPAAPAWTTPAMPLLIAIIVADLLVLGSLLAMGVAQGIIF